MPVSAPLREEERNTLSHELAWRCRCALLASRCGGEPRRRECAPARLELLVAPSWWSVRPCIVIVLRHIFARVEL